MDWKAGVAASSYGAMRTAVRIWGLGFASVALVLSAGAAFAEGASRANTADDRWVPAFSFYSGAQVRNQEGRVSGPLQVEVGHREAQHAGHPLA